jgi:hypothetical protein
MFVLSHRSRVAFFLSCLAGLPHCSATWAALGGFDTAANAEDTGPVVVCPDEPDQLQMALDGDLDAWIPPPYTSNQVDQDDTGSATEALWISLWDPPDGVPLEACEAAAASFVQAFSDRLIWFAIADQATGDQWADPLVSLIGAPRIDNQVCFFAAHPGLVCYLGEFDGP